MRGAPQELLSSALTSAFVGFPGLRAVVHGAGSFQTGLLDALSIDDWRQSFVTNEPALSRRDLTGQAQPRENRTRRLRLPLSSILPILNERDSAVLLR